MLFDSHICKVQAQNFAMLEKKYFQQNAFANDCQVLMPLRLMFCASSQMTYAYASEAFNVLSQRGMCEEKDFEHDYELFATYGVLLSSLVFGYDTAEPNKDKRLSMYTMSMSYLRVLASKGFLVGKKDPIEIELQEIEKACYEGTRIKNTIKDGHKVVAVRLDYEVFGNKVIFKPTGKKVTLDLMNVMITPYDAFSTCMYCLNDLLQRGMYRITMGDKARVVTNDAQLLSVVYGEARANTLLRQMKDPRTARFYVPVVGASVYTAGVTNIKITEIDKIEQLGGITDVDLTELNMNFSMVKTFYENSLNGLDKESLLGYAKTIGIVDTSTSKEELITWCCALKRKQPAHELWQEMKQYPKIFKLANYSKLTSKFGTDYIPVTIPSTKEDFDALLKCGIFKILTRKRDGSYSTIIGTNNQKALKRVLGDDYFGKYEPEGNRLRALEFEIKNTITSETVSDAQFKAICQGYKLFDLYDLVKSISIGTSIKKSDILGCISDEQDEVQYRKTVINQPHLSIVRSVEAILAPDGKAIDYLKYVDVASVVDLVCLCKM